ncbi:unnamed protein product [Gordionus sp. m RMFG-2023]
MLQTASNYSEPILTSYTTLFVWNKSAILAESGLMVPKNTVHLNNTFNLPMCVFYSHSFVWNYGTVYELIIGPILLILGFLGNIAGLIYLKSLPMKSLGDIFMQYMVSFSLLYCVFYTTWLIEKIRIKYYSIYSLNEKWMEYVSRYQLIFMKSSSKAGIFSFLMILMDRYVSLSLPFKYATFRSRRILKFLPIPFWILAMAICVSSRFWYGVRTCIYVYQKYDINFKSRFINNHVFDYAITHDGQIFFRLYYQIKLHEPLWIFYYDIMRETFLSVIPGIIILFFGIYITISLLKFLKNRTIVPRTLDPVRSFTPAITLRKGSKHNSTLFEIMNSSLSLKNIIRHTWKRDMLRNVSSLIYFFIYLACQIPSLITIVIRQHLENIRPYTRLNIDRLIESGINLELIFFIAVIYIMLSIDKRFRSKLAEYGNQINSLSAIHIHNQI